MNFPMKSLPDGTPISAFGFGCSSYWSSLSFPEGNAVELVRRAQQLGINHFDTGPSYGWGEAERRLGIALKSLDRRGLVISTKAGTFKGPGEKRIKSFEPDQLRDSVAGSLTRLGIEQIDVLYLHGPEAHDLSPRLIDCLTGMKTQGLIRYSGINTFDRGVLNRITSLPFDVVMTQYNVFDVTRLDMIESLRASGKVIVAGTALGQGIFNFDTLVPKDRKSLWYLLRTMKNDPFFPITRWRARRRIASMGCAPLEAAMSFLLRTPSVTSSIFGTTSTAHLEQNVDAALTVQARFKNGGRVPC
jgi:D-threo-aldose 1-dehydrogenase